MESWEPPALGMAPLRPPLVALPLFTKVSLEAQPLVVAFLVFGSLPETHAHLLILLASHLYPAGPAAHPGPDHAKWLQCGWVMMTFFESARPEAV